MPHVHDARRRLGPDVITQLVADYESGQPSTYLMVTYGLGKGSVLRLLRDAGVELRRQGQRNIDVLEAAAHYEAGYSLARLAAIYGCGAETVRQALLAHGVAVRPRRGRL